MKKITASWFIFLMFLVRFTGAQDTSHTDFEVIASVSGARALATDPDGLIYVVSASELIQFDDRGIIKARLDGTSAGVFGELSDVDPGNGLIWTVADEERGNLLRFSKELLYLETIRVPGNRGTEWRHSPQPDLHNGVSSDSGQPIAVETGVTGDLFAIDASSGSVLKWDASRRLERVIGGFGTGLGQLTEPVDLATDETSLYVADRAPGVIRVYDYFGGYIREFSTGQDMKSITVAGEELWVVFSGYVRVYDDQGRLVRQIVLELGDSLIAAVPVFDHVVFLTRERLLRIEM